MSTHETNTKPVKQFAHESIAASERGPSVALDSEVLPWLDGPVELTSALITMKDRECPPFLVASAIGTSDQLTHAAEAMTPNQRVNTDNMFWSRVGNFVRDGYHPKVETMPKSSTEDPIHIMRNNGGQRVYFMLRTTDKGMPTIIRLAACDKNRQKFAMKVLSGAKDKERQRLASEN